MEKEQNEFEKVPHEEKNNTSYTFVCPKCGNEIDPSSICTNCFPSGAYESRIEEKPYTDFESLSFGMLQEVENGEKTSIESKENHVENVVDSESIGWREIWTYVQPVVLFFKKHKKKLLIASSLLMCVVVAYNVYQYFSPKGKLLLFVEKNHLVYSYSNKPDKKQVIEKNWGKNIGIQESEYQNFLSARASKNQRYIFYRDLEITNLNDGNQISTYYRFDVQENKKIKVDEQVDPYFIGEEAAISTDGTKAFYIKGSDRELIYWNDGKKTTIDKSVSSYYVNKQSSLLFYVSTDGIYEWSEKVGKIRVGESEHFQGLSTDKEKKLTVYYVQDQALYSKRENEEAKCITTKNGRFLLGFDHKVYYAVQKELPFVYRDFIEETVEEDNNMQYPDSFMMERETIRESLDKQVSDVVSDLYYFDGKESTLIDTNIFTYDIYGAMKSSTLIYRKFDETLLQNEKGDQILETKIDISGLYSMDSLKYFLTEQLIGNSEVWLAKGAEKGLIEQNHGSRFTVSSNGKQVSFIDDVTENSLSASNWPEGTLKQLNIENVNALKPEVVDEKVSTFYFEGENLYYSKDMPKRDLYLNGKELLSDVDDYVYYSFNKIYANYQVADKSNKKILYKINGSSKQKLDQNVEKYMPVDKKTVFYIKGYNKQKGYGTLLVKQGDKKAEEISKRAQMLVQSNSWYSYY